MRLSDKKVIILIVLLFFTIIGVSIWDSLKRDNNNNNNNHDINNKIESSDLKEEKNKSVLDKDHESFEKINNALNMDKDTLKKKENEIKNKANDIKTQRIKNLKDNYMKVVNGGDNKLIEEFVSKKLFSKILKEKKDYKDNKIKIKIIKINLVKVEGNPELQQYTTNEELEIDTNGKKELKKISVKYSFNTLEQIFETMDLIKQGE